MQAYPPQTGTTSSDRATKNKEFEKPVGPVKESRITESKEGGVLTPSGGASLEDSSQKYLNSNSLQGSIIETNGADFADSSTTMDDVSKSQRLKGAKSVQNHGKVKSSMRNRVAVQAVVDVVDSTSSSSSSLDSQDEVNEDGGFEQFVITEGQVGAGGVFNPDEIGLVCMYVLMVQFTCMYSL